MGVWSIWVEVGCSGWVAGVVGFVAILWWVLATVFFLNILVVGDCG